MVKLYHPLKGVRFFTEEHASNLMAIPANRRGGWELHKEEETKQPTKSDNDNRGNKRTGKDKQK